MVRSLRGLLVIALALVLAGCITTPDGDPIDPSDTRFQSADGIIDHAALAEFLGAPIDPEHDHRDPNEPDHHGGKNLELLSWSTLGIELGYQGFANFVFYEDADETLAFVAVDGDTEAGFVIADITDPRNVEPLGSYMMTGSSVQEVRVTPDGQYALMNVQDIPDPTALAGTEPTRECTVCLHLVDVTDRNDPVWMDALPVNNLGTHNMHIHAIDGTVYVFYVGQPLSYEHPTNLPGNYIGIARIAETPDGAKLVKVREWRDPTVSMIDEGRSFPHDVMVYEHPGTGQHIGYLSYWDGGAVTVDFSNPVAPMTLDVNRDMTGSGALAIHWFAPEPAARHDGRLIAWSAPEIGQLDSDTGVIRGYDVTDPSNVEQISHWGIPGEVYIPGAYVLSGHTTVADMERGLLAVGHYHGGIWILDISDPKNPRHTAYYMPNGNESGPYQGEIWWKKPNFNPEGFLPNVYQARWYDDLLFVTERGTGLYVLEYTGPVPGPLAEEIDDD